MLFRSVQVKDELYCLGRKKRLKVPVVFGGMPIDKEILTIKQKSHIVVGTPGRVMDHIRRGTLNLSQIKYVVIDEADHMLDMGFMEEVEEILGKVEGNNPQINLFSATFETNIDTIIERYMKHPKYITVESESKTVDTIQQTYYEIDKENKFTLLQRILIIENPKGCIIFCDTREMVESLFQMLKRKSIKSGALHGGMDQKVRLATIEDFRQNRFRFLVTTDRKSVV